MPKNGIGVSIDVFGHTRQLLGRGLLPLSQRSVAEWTARVEGPQYPKAR